MRPGLRVATLVVAAVLAAITVLMPGHAVTVYACSAGEDWSPIAESEVVVAGRITGWSEAEPLPNTPASFPFEPIRVEFVVEHVFKGQPASTTIDFIDASSRSEDYGPPGWHGSSGACGAFNADPSGSYAILGLLPAEDGTLRSNLLTTFYIGSEPAGERYESAIERLHSLGVTRLPITGTGPLTTDEAGIENRLLLPAIIALSLLGAGALATRGIKTR